MDCESQSPVRQLKRLRKKSAAKSPPDFQTSGLAPALLPVPESAMRPPLMDQPCNSSPQIKDHDQGRENQAPQLHSQACRQHQEHDSDCVTAPRVHRTTTRVQPKAFQSQLNGRFCAHIVRKCIINLMN